MKISLHFTKTLLKV